MTLTGTLGKRAEKLAFKYLRKQGLKPRDSNYFCRYGEIDLIMQDGEYLVFVEVRYRASSEFGGALESITPSKQRKLRNSAEDYLMRHKLTNNACRFDILCLDGDIDNASLQWIKNAF